MEVTNPAALAALVTGDLGNFLVAATPGGIEAQEAAGQAALVRAADHLPSEIIPRSVTREMLGQAWGVTFGEEAEDIFVQATLPAGWTIRATDHSMHSELIDAAGNVRAGIFYKAAFYDRRAHLSLKRRYRVENDFGDVEYHLTAIDEKAGVMIRDFGTAPRRDLAKLSLLEDTANQWLKSNYPEFDDPLAYWND
jgi:hypothetical protein